LLKVNNLSVSLSDNDILNNLDLSFEDKKITAIIGKNGCGKSTLLKSLEGLLDCSGDIILDDINLNELSIKERAKLISYLPQNRPTPNISGRLMIEHGRFPYLSFAKALSEQDINIVNNVINEMNLDNLVHKKLDEMSGGEVQKVYIASTVAQQTKVILLDEPTNHLDLENQIEILNLISKLKEDGKTIIIVMHDLLQAFTYADYIYLIDDKKVVLSGKPNDIIKSKEIENIFKYKLVEDKDSNSLYKYKLQEK